MDAWENVNVASANKAIATQLHAQVRAFFEAHARTTLSTRVGINEMMQRGDARAPPDQSDPYDN
jgi:hypothetical protein